MAVEVRTGGGSERQSRAVVVFPSDEGDQGQQQQTVPAWRFQSEDNALTNTRQSKSQFVNPLGKKSALDCKESLQSDNRYSICQRLLHEYVTHRRSAAFVLLMVFCC